MGQSGRRTKFGRVLMGVVGERGVYKYTELARALTDAGYRAEKPKPGVSRTAVTNWCTGKQAVPNDLLPWLDTLYNLTEDEKRALAYAYAWEQGTFKNFLSVA